MCCESSHVQTSSDLAKDLDMISFLLLFQALWEWVGENSFLLLFYEVLQCAVTVHVFMCVCIVGWRYIMDILSILVLLEQIIFILLLLYSVDENYLFP